MYRFFKKDRPVLFELAGKLRLKATFSDDSVLAALAHAREHSPVQVARLHPAAATSGGGRTGAWASRSPRQIGGARSPTAATRADLKKLDAAIGCVVNAFAELNMVKASA